MPSSFGTTLTVTVFGQSHSEAIGCVIDGLPSGLTIDQDALATFSVRRAPGRMPWDTPRLESDSFRVLSGLTSKSVTCGAPIALLIENSDARSSDYDRTNSVFRPGHADFSAWKKWHGRQDAYGGGQFSGRLTAPLCLAGGIALQALEHQGIQIAAHVQSAAGIADEPFDAFSNNSQAQVHLEHQIAALHDGRIISTINQEAGEKLTAALMEIRAEGDTTGGLVECVATGFPAGVGSPLFDGLESRISQAIFSIPAVKGIEFGLGFRVSEARGSFNNDPYEIRNGQPQPATNNAGGILGGISTGAPLLFSCAFKPVPSISLPQQSVDYTSNEEITLQVHGRHDTCVALRAVPVVEGMTALVLLDALLSYPAEPKRNPYEE